MPQSWSLLLCPIWKSRPIFYRVWNEEKKNARQFYTTLNHSYIHFYCTIFLFLAHSVSWCYYYHRHTPSKKMDIFSPFEEERKGKVKIIPLRKTLFFPNWMCIWLVRTRTTRTYSILSESALRRHSRLKYEKNAIWASMLRMGCHTCYLGI